MATNGSGAPVDGLTAATKVPVVATVASGRFVSLSTLLIVAGFTTTVTLTTLDLVAT